MKIRVSPETVSRYAAPLVRGLARTWRIRTRHEERWRALYEGRRPHVFLLWHEVLLPLLWHHRRQGVAIVVSEAREGQYLADFAESLGYRLLRGSSTRGGARALLGAVKELRSGGAVAFTPDGPRGPRRELKPGIITAAQRSGAIIVPIHARVSRGWRLNSWDRFVIPKPLARIVVEYGEPFGVEDGSDAFDRGVARASAALAQLAEGDRWRDGAIHTG